MRQISVAIAFMVMLSGCEVSPGHGNALSSNINGTGGQLYVSTPNSILHFINAKNTSGNVAPASVISGPDTGNVTPVAEIAGSNTLLQFPGQIALNKRQQ